MCSHFVVVDDYNLPQGQRTKVYYGRWEVMLIIETALKMSTKSLVGEHLACIQTCTILVMLLHTAVRPSTLSFSHPEFLEQGMVRLFI